MRVKIDAIVIDSCSKLIKVDGVILCKVVKLNDGKIALQVKDPNKLRAGARGSVFLEVSLSDFLEVIDNFDVDCLTEIR